MSQNRLYFGYGSNLDWEDWTRFCSKLDVNPLGLKERESAWLIGHHLKFHYRSSGRKGGAADAVPINAYHATAGALFEVDEEAWTALVAKEGAPNYYREKDVLVVGCDGKFHNATTFVVCEHRKEANFVQPTDVYYQLIHRGLEDRGLPTAGLEQAMQEPFQTPTIKHLFVYGTLMQNQTRFNQIKPYCLSIQQASTKGLLHHLGSFPGLKLGEGTVHGELVEMNDVEQCLEQMDCIEGFLGFGHPDSLFHRTIVQIQTNSGTQWAWTYVYGGSVDAYSTISDGRWV